MNSLRHILSPITIKSMTLANRVVMPPMGTNLGHDDGTVSPENLAYLKRRAKGQPGLIITEITAAHPGGIAYSEPVRGLRRPVHTGTFQDWLPWPTRPGPRSPCRSIMPAGRASIFWVRERRWRHRRSRVSSSERHHGR